MSAVGSYSSVQELEKLKALPILKSTALTKEEEAAGLAARISGLGLDSQGNETDESRAVRAGIQEANSSEAVGALDDPSGCWLKTLLSRKIARLDQPTGPDIYASNVLHLAVAERKTTHVALMLLYPEGKTLINEREKKISPQPYPVPQIAHLLRQLDMLYDQGGESSKRGLTPLQIAAYDANPLMIRLLLEQGADPTVQNVQGSNVLQQVKRLNSPTKMEHYEEIVEILTKALPKEESKESGA